MTRQLHVRAAAAVVVAAFTASVLRAGQSSNAPLSVGDVVLLSNSTDANASGALRDALNNPDAAVRTAGVIISSATIAPSGCVSHVRVVRRIPMLDVAVLLAISGWAFEPTLLNGVAVPIQMTITTNFALQ